MKDFNMTDRQRVIFEGWNRLEAKLNKHYQKLDDYKREYNNEANRLSGRLFDENVAFMVDWGNGDKALIASNDLIDKVKNVIRTQSLPEHLAAADAARLAGPAYDHFMGLRLIASPIMNPQKSLMGIHLGGP